MKKIVFVFLTVFGSLVLAQNISKDSADFFKANVTVIGSYEPKLMDFSKKNFSPVIVPDTLSKPSFSYQINSKRIPLSIQLSPISPAKLSGEQFIELKNNYLVAGVGIRKHFFGELFLGTGRNKNKTAGLHLQNLSTFGKIENFAYPGRTHTQVDAFYNHYWKNFAIKISPFYCFDQLHWYGFRTHNFEDTISSSEIRQYYHKPGLTISTYNTPIDSTQWMWQTKLSYDYLMDKYSYDEHLISGQIQIKKDLHLIKQINKEKLSLTLRGHSWLQNYPTGGTHASLVEIIPTYELDFKQFTLAGLLNTTLQLDSVGETYFFPGFILHVTLFPEVISIYGGMDGSMNYASKHYLVDINPFVSYRAKHKFAKTPEHYYGGVVGNIAHRWNHNLSVHFRNIHYHPLFVPDTFSPPYSSFLVVYDSIRWLQVIFEQQMVIQHRFKTGMTVVFNEAQTVRQQKAWYIPRWEIDAFLQYNLQNKILITPQMTFKLKRSALRYLPPNFQTISLSDAYDLNLFIEYIYSSNLSFFMNFYNILNQQYRVWDNYPVYGFRLLGGIKYSF
ncbi:MAG: hypothetical protein N2Z72_02725 [Bacteroidales bacterium]|nr:hypothetical protein [Bacteroidales bacterium]